MATSVAGELGGTVSEGIGGVEGVRIRMGEDFMNRGGIELSGDGGAAGDGCEDEGGRGGVRGDGGEGGGRGGDVEHVDKISLIRCSISSISLVSLSAVFFAT